MNSYLTIQEAAALRGCSARNMQLLCRQGSIPGCRKLSGVWLLPADAVLPGGRRAETEAVLHPERLYGRNTAVRLSSAPGERPEEGGCAVSRYEILEGITLVFQDIHAGRLDYGSGPPPLPRELIAVQHCREGRFEGEYPDGECICMGPGSLSVNLPAWAPCANSFPLGHYRGLYIALLPDAAAASVRRLEEVLGPLRIDLAALTARLSRKNRLAFYPADEGTERLLSSLYPAGEAREEGELKLGVLALLRRLCARQAQPPGPEQYFTREQVRAVREIRQYLIAHLDEHIPLPELAARFRISLTGMKACFKGVYGRSPGKYLREYRMQAGAEQLSSTGLRIIEIAAALGYENASKFSEAFAGYYGMSPSEYRKTFCPSGALPDGRE